MRVPRGVHRVVISSPLSLLPTWLTDIDVEGVEVILRVRYREFRQNLTGLAISVDHASRTSTVQASYSLPATNSSFHYVGTPVIFFVDQSLYMRAFKGDVVYEWFTAMRRPYQGPFNTVLAGAEAEERVVVDGLILYVSLPESYVPVFDVEAEMVVKS